MDSLKKIIISSFLFISCREKAHYPFEIDAAVENKSVAWRLLGEFEPKEAKLRSAGQVKTVLSLLESSFNVYQGELPQPKECQVSSLPKEVKGSTADGFSRLLSLYASDTKMLGLCADPTKIVKTQYLLLYCSRSKKLFAVKYFYPKSERWLDRPVARCLELQK